MTDQIPLRERIEVALLEYGFNPIQAEFLSTVASNPHLQAIQHERDRQDLKWGPQSYPSFGAEVNVGHREQRATDFKILCDYNHNNGTGSWEDILSEEFYEAMAETQDETKLREELIQVAAVVVAWAEDLVIKSNKREDANVETETEPTSV